MLDRVKRLLPHDFRQLLKRRLFSIRDVESRLMNLRQVGFLCTGVIDGGAYEGEWTRMFWRVFPGRPSVMVEPLPAKHERLAGIASRVPGSKTVSAAIGRAPRADVPLVIRATNSSVLDSVANVAPSDQVALVPMTTLDDILRDGNVSANLLKLDLQGHELEALEGCSQLSTTFEVILLEVSLIRIGEVPLFSEVDRYLEARGFRLYDVVPQYYRPLDGALWQCDVLYAATGSPLLASRSWSAEG